MQLDEEHRDWLALALVPGVGTAHFIRLLARFHAPGNVLKASEGALRDVVGPSLAQRIRQYREVVDIEAQELAMAEYAAHLVTLEDSLYPVRLAEIYDPPLLLFVRGTLIEQDVNSVAIVGTRRPTPYGLRMAEKFGRELAARGITVVSGLASGIDAAAHRGAIEGGGRTIAVLGNGVNVVYPPENAELMDQITRHGAVVSQFPMNTKPSKGHFPYRNRIISGMSQGVLIVEAPLSSGALITARQAAEQGREVFAVPGQIGVNNSQGPHALIREGAKLVESVEDILVELELPVTALQPASRAAEPARKEPERRTPAAAPAPEPQRSPIPSPVQQPSPRPAAATATAPPLSRTEQEVVSVLSPEGSFVDEIAAACHISVSEALSTLTILELKGLVRQFSGKRFAPR